MKKRTTIIIGLALSLLMVLFSAGCGSQDGNEGTQTGEETLAGEANDQTQSDASGSGVPQLSIEVISDSNMDESFVSMFEQGVQEQLDQMGNGSRMTHTVSADSAAELIDQGLSEGYDGIILVGDEDQLIANASKSAAQEGLPVLSFQDNLNNGYNMAAPGDMGKAMTEALVSRIALSKGPDEWGDQTDFGKQLERAVQGNWRTSNSSGDMKTFVNPYVMEFSKNSAGINEMTRVSLIEEIKDTPDGKGYSYVLNTGNSYYLYPDDSCYLGCHWEPDGYSGSDSLAKETDDPGESIGGNSLFVLDMNSYSDSEEYFRGTLTTFDGHGAMGPEVEECISLNLEEPLRVFLTDGRDVLLSAIQLNMDPSLSGDIDNGTVVKVTGKLFEAHTDHHFTPVLMNVSNVE